MTDKEMVEKLKASLVPRGTAPLVYITVYNNYFNKEFIDKVIDDVERLQMRLAMGVELTNLERFALSILFENAGIPIKSKENIRE